MPKKASVSCVSNGGRVNQLYNHICLLCLKMSRFGLKGMPSSVVDVILMIFLEYVVQLFIKE